MRVPFADGFALLAITLFPHEDIREGHGNPEVGDADGAFG